MQQHLTALNDIVCPICRNSLAKLGVDPTREPLPGINGYLILCEACAGLIVLKPITNTQDQTCICTLRVMTTQEKIALRNLPIANQIKQIQENLASKLGHG